MLKQPERGERVLTAFGETRASACTHHADGSEHIPHLKSEDVAAFAVPQPGKVRWLRVEGLADRKMLQAVADAFGLHPLAVEDITHLAQRPKLEVYEHGYVIIFPRLNYGKRLRMEQISLFLGDGWVLSFSPGPVSEFDQLESRLQAGRGKIREGGGDRLLYNCLDALIDGLQPNLSVLDESFARVENKLQGRHPDSVVYNLREMRSDLFRAHTLLRALQGALISLHADRDDWLDDGLQPYVKDLVDHVAQDLDHVENLRESVADAQQLYHALLSQRINDVMRVLTIMSVIFMPLSFIAGVYGMNFEHMPELRSAWGYPLALLLMLGVAVGLMFFFNRKGWLGQGKQGRAKDSADGDETL